MKKMKETNEFITFLNSSISFTPNYQDIRTKIDETKFQKKHNKKYLIKGVLLVLYTFIICFFSILLTSIIKEKNYIKHSLEIDKKSKEYVDASFDNFFAMGNKNYFQTSTLDIVLKSNMISKENKAILINYQEKYKDKSNYDLFNIYLGRKNNKDIILLVSLAYSNISFIFDSHLSYSYQEVINKFKEQSGNNNLQDYQYNLNEFDENVKIMVSFKTINDLYFPYYLMEFDGQIYVIDMNA